jgi:hypothetical protein
VARWEKPIGPFLFARHPKMQEPTVPVRGDELCGAGGLSALVILTRFAAALAGLVILAALLVVLAALLPALLLLLAGLLANLRLILLARAVLALSLLVVFRHRFLLRLFKLNLSRD